MKKTNENLKKQLVGKMIASVNYVPMTNGGFEWIQIVTGDGVIITVAVDPNSDKSNLSIV